MNKHAIAIAADSAATISTPYGDKIFNSSEKVFNLIRGYPVGLMVYNRAELMGVPWEVIVKRYRDSKPNSIRPHLADIASDFIGFLNKMFLVDDETRFLGTESDRICDELLLKIEDNLHLRIEGDATPSACLDVIDDEFLSWSEVGQHLCVSSAELGVIEKKYTEGLLWLIQRKFGRYNLSEEYINKIKDLIFIQITRLSRTPLNSIVTGIVICGYGKDDIFPSSKAFIISGKLNGKLIYESNLSGVVDFTNPAHISGYAQHQIVDLFLRGRHPDYNDMIDSMIHDLLLQYPLSALNIVEDEIKKDGIIISEGIRERITERIQQMGKERYEKYLLALDKTERENYGNDIMRIITHLPKEELGIVAETLVNLASFQRKITPGSQTVGGPIDVAIISKKDGFVWIKRKHYFSKELNPDK